MIQLRTLLTGVVVLCVTSCLTGCSGMSRETAVHLEGRDALQLRAINQQTKAEACKLTALELASHEKDEHAISQFEQARKLDPEIKGVSHPLAVLYDRQRRLDAAQREYEKAIKESPKNANAFNDYGYFLYSRGEYPAAQKHLKRSLELNKNHPKARINLAMTMAAENDFEAAFAQFEQALGPAAAHHNVGLLQIRAGLQEQGIANLQRAAERDPSLQSTTILAAHRSGKSTSSDVLPASFTQ